MKTQPTATVLNGQVQCRGAEASFRTHREDVGTKLTEYFAPYTPEGSEPVDYRVVLHSLELATRDLRLNLVDREQTYLDSKVNRNERYNDTRQSTKATRDHLLDLKSSSEGIHGEESHAKLGIAGALPSASIGVLRVGKRVYDLLENPEELKLAEASKVGAKLDTQEARTQLKPLVDDLQDKVTAYDDSKRVAEQALELRRGAERRFREEYPAIVRTGVGFYRLVGEKKAADRLRVASRRRPGDAETDLPQTPTEKPPADGEPTREPPESPEAAPESVA